MNAQSPQELSKAQREVIKHKGTEQPFSGALLENTEEGTYTCANCGHVLFTSGEKFSSSTGWPSFSDVANAKSVNYAEDTSHGMVRTEVTCANCDGHLGHVFDGSYFKKDTKHFCINSVSLNFIDKQGTMRRGDGKND